MYKKLRYVLYVFFLTIHTLIKTSNFELYNAQPYPIYYAIQNSTLLNNEQDFQQLPAYAYVNLQLENNTIQLIALKELPVTQQKITVIKFEPQQATTNIYVKTHETHDGILNIIPQSKNPLHHAQTVGQLELKNCISPYEIWKTTLIYTPHLKQIEQDIPSHNTETKTEPQESLTTICATTRSDNVTTTDSQSPLQDTHDEIQTNTGTIPPL
jgi:hypothetical protein